MSKYRIVCTEVLPVSAPRQHQHIVAVGVDTDNDGVANFKETLKTVIESIRGGKDSYYTVGNITNKIASVEVAFCAICGHLIIKTRPDNTRDNNLEGMRNCKWGNL